MIQAADTSDYGKLPPRDNPGTPDPPRRYGRLVSAAAAASLLMAVATGCEMWSTQAAQPIDGLRMTTAQRAPCPVQTTERSGGDEGEWKRLDLRL